MRIPLWRNKNSRAPVSGRKGRSEKMESYQFLSPRKIVVKTGGLASAGTLAKELGSKALVCVGGSSSRKNGSLDRLMQSLRQAGVGTVLYEGIRSDPDVETVEKGRALCGESGCDMVVGMGGGSVLDTAKSIGLLAANGGKLTDYETARPGKPMLPMLAVPTTAGTGSEVTKMAVVTDPARKKKMLISCEEILPDIALLDAELTYSMPARVAAATGMDALTHAMEAYLSDNAGPVTDLFARKAVGMIAANLHAAVYNPKNAEAKKNMMAAQMYAGLAFGNTMTCLVHSMSRPLGVYYGIPHGEANAVLLAAVMEFNLPSCVSRMADMAEAMGLSGEGEWGLAEALTAHLHKMHALLPLRHSLAEMHVRREDLRPMAESAFAAGTTKVNPRKPTVEDIVSLYEKLL